MKPAEYRMACVVNQDISYEVASDAMHGTHASTGMLHRGRVIWVQKNPRDCVEGELLSAYAEGVGVVLLNPAYMGTI